MLLLAPDAAATARLPVHENLVARVALQDGRTLELPTAIQPPRPKVELVNKSVRLTVTSSAIHLGDKDELPQDGQLSFLLKTVVPDSFPHSEQIEVATMDGGSDGFLSLANGGLVLQDAETVLATIDPVKRLGSSAFGLLQFRPVDDSGAKGDWQPLAKLVRTPSLVEIRCPDDPAQSCDLKGSALFLLDSIASTPDFSDTVSVPAGYSDGAIKVPRPHGTILYVKLRDDPATIDTVTLPVFPDRY